MFLIDVVARLSAHDGQNMKKVLAPAGVIATQGECLWLHLPLIRTVLEACAELFPSVDYAFTTVPSYPSGQIGFILASAAERGKISPAPMCTYHRCALITITEELRG